MKSQEVTHVMELELLPFPMAQYLATILTRPNVSISFSYINQAPRFTFANLRLLRMVRLWIGGVSATPSRSSVEFFCEYLFYYFFIGLAVFLYSKNLYNGALFVITAAQFLIS